jgi:hypothetical protein
MLKSIAAALLSLAVGALPCLAQDITGTWTSDAYATNFQHVRLTHAFRDGQAVMTLAMKNATPNQPRAKLVERRGRYRVLGPSSIVAGAWEVDVTVDAVAITLLDPVSVELGNGAHNQSLYCDLSGWRLGEPKSVLGRDCGGMMAQAGDVEKILVKRDGDKLYVSPYWGPGRVGVDRPTRAVRAVAVDDAHPLLKQP